ncbi:MAG: cation transporter, partial [Fimbriimonadaceae bacterium]|nr:cation transporter [Fimbriimonadaceae bacterium]
MNSAASDRQETRLKVQGMTCAACVRRVERALTRTEGTVEATVNFATHEASVSHAPGLDPESLVQAIEKAGYAAHPLEAEEEAPPEAPPSPGNLILSALLTLPVFVVSMALHPGPEWMNWAMTLPAAVVI